MKYEICKMIVFGTACITEEDAERLDKEEISVFHREFGWAINVGDDRTTDGTFKEYSEAFQNLAKLTVEQDCLWLMLDEAADSHGQPTFEW